MHVEVRATAEDAVAAAADLVAERLRVAAHERGIGVLALSRSSALLDSLAASDVPWDRVHVFQVDERAAPRDHPERNLRPIESALVDGAGLPLEQLHEMPVESIDLEEAATQYAETLRSVTGGSSVFDAVHLGLGTDGHTASLIPGDAVLDVADRYVAVTAPYLGWMRMTLTFPVLDRAQAIVWLVHGAPKALAVAAMVNGEDIPAARVRADRAVLVIDAAAATALHTR